MLDIGDIHVVIKVFLLQTKNISASQVFRAVRATPTMTGEEVRKKLFVTLLNHLHFILISNIRD